MDGFMQTFQQLPTQVFMLFSAIWSGLIVLEAIVHGRRLHWSNLLWFSISIAGFLVSVGIMGNHP